MAMMELYDSLCGGTSRCDQLYLAQLAYYRGEFDKALELFQSRAQCQALR